MGRRLRKNSVPCAMTIAGSDSGGGAGIEADLKTFSALGVFGTCALTAITAQNTRRVHEVFPVPADMVKRQIEVVLEDLPVKDAKTGILYSKEVIAAVAETIDRYRLRVVVDPVFRAGSGNLLIREEDKQALTELLVPRACVVTPNRFEAEDMAQMRIESVEHMREAARKVSDLGAGAVVVKGGHLDGNVVTDVLYHKGEFKVFTKPRLEVSPHGGGCAFSAAIAAYLALGCEVAEAVAKAENFIEEAIRFGLKVGEGRLPVNPMVHLRNEAEKFQVLENVSVAARMIEEHAELTPYAAEVGTQVAMALPYASSKWHVAAVQGRIVRFDGRLKAVGCTRFGASDHLARVILTAMKHDRKARAAVNLRYSRELVEAFKGLGFLVSSFDRSLEPPEVRDVEGRTLGWGVDEAVKAAGGRVPDVIYDLGGVGREPMIRVLGESATKAVEKILAVVRALKARFATDIYMEDP